MEIAGIAPSPNDAWMIQVGRNLTGHFDGFLAEKKLLILDRDSKYFATFRDSPKGSGVEVVRLPPRSPDSNTHAERFVNPIQDECLVRMILFGGRSLRNATREFAARHRRERNHQGLSDRRIAPEGRAGSTLGPIQRSDRPGGLLGADLLAATLRAKRAAASSMDALRGDRKRIMAWSLASYRTGDRRKEPVARHSRLYSTDPARILSSDGGLENRRMCLGVPGKILRIERGPLGLDMGTVSFGGVTKEVCLAYVPEAREGDYVIVHVGFAINTIDEKEAEETLETLRRIGDLPEIEEEGREGSPA